MTELICFNDLTLILQTRIREYAWSALDAHKFTQYARWVVDHKGLSAGKLSEILGDTVVDEILRELGALSTLGSVGD